MAITFDPNDPLAVQQRSIEREREMAQALLAQGLKSSSGGGQMAGRVFIPDYGSPLSDLANVFVGKHLAGKADEKEAVLADRRNERFAQILRRANEAETGTPEQAAVPGKGYGGSDIYRDDEGNLLPGATAEKPAVAAKPGSRREAAMILITSPDPTQRALGLKKLEDIKLGEGEVLKDADGKDIAKGGEKQTDDIREYNLARQQQGFTGSFQQWLLAQKQASAQQISINNFVPAKQKLQTDQAAGLVDSATKLQGVPHQITRLQTAQDLVPSSYTGKFADLKTTTVKALTSAGISLEKSELDKATNTDTLKSLLFDAVLENLRQVDAQPSQSQQKALQEAMGNIDTDPRALLSILEFTREKLVERLNTHNRNVAAGEKTLGPDAFIYPITIKPEMVHRLPVKDREAWNAAQKAKDNPLAQEVIRRLEKQYGQPR